MRKRYNHEKQEFYKKVIPVITFMLLALSIAIEVLYRVFDHGEITLLTSTINWGCLFAFFLLCFIIRVASWSSWFVCPLLTCLTYYYFAFIDYDRTVSILYFRYLKYFYIIHNIA